MPELQVKILIVDDQVAIGQVLQTGLEMHGFTVRYEPRSAEAVKTCLEFHPDLVLLDVDMPVKDGGQVATELLNHPTLRNTPVIFLTSLVTQEEARLNASGRNFLSKPVPIMDLVARIHSVLQTQTSP